MSVFSIDEIANLKIGGRLKSYYHTWETYTSDPYILQAVSGYKIEFKETVPYQPASQWPIPYKLNALETEAIDSEIVKLQEKGVIQSTEHNQNQYVSNIFTRPKKDGATE